MTNLIKRTVLSLAVVASLISGCASGNINLIKTGEVSVESVGSERVSIFSVDVKSDGENLIISGKVRRKHNLPQFIRGHIDVAVTDPEGNILGKIGIPYSPNTIPRRNAGRSYFKVKVPVVPSQGTRVRVEFHGGLEIPPEERQF